MNELAKKIHEDTKAHGFWNGERNFGEVIALIHSELSEALEEYRKGKEYNETYYEADGKPCGIPSELADAIIRILDFCGAENVDIDKIIEQKIDYNKKRPYKNGNKRF